MVTATRRRRRAPRLAKPVETTEEKKLLKPEEVGKRLNIGKTQVYVLMNSGGLGYVDLGERCRRIDPDVLEEYIRAQSKKSRTAV